MLEKEKKYVIGELKKIDNTYAIVNVENKVFAFQQINKKSYKPEDDKRIFESIITTIKAANYEKKCANESSNPKSNLWINYNLLSVFDGPMINVHYKNDDKIVMDAKEIKYINQHIINGKQRFYRVHFINSEVFEQLLSCYDKMAEENAEFCYALEKEFYTDLLSNSNRERAGHIWKRFEVELMDKMNDEDFGSDMHSVYSNIRFENYELSDDGKSLTISCNLDLFTNPKALVSSLNKNRVFKRQTRKYLKKYFRYLGEFRYELA